MKRSRIASYLFVAGLLLLLGVGWHFKIGGTPNRSVLLLGGLAFLGGWAAFCRLSRLARREKLMRIVAANAALLLALGALEVVALIGGVDYRPVFGRVVLPWESLDNLEDRELMHVHPPHYRARARQNGGDISLLWNAPAKTIFEYDIQYDHQGMRNAVDYERADCIVIGDSVIEAYQVGDDEIVTTRLAAALGKTVVNLSQTAYGPQQELGLLERFGIPLRPEACVWMYFEGNDLKDIWRYIEYDEGWPASVAHYKSWRSRSFLKNALGWLAGRLYPAKHDQPVCPSAKVVTGDGMQEMWFGYPGQELSEHDIEALDITTGILAKANALCRENGIRFVVVFVPTKYRVYHRGCRPPPDSPVVDWVVSDHPGRLREQLRGISEDIGFFDLTPALQSAAAKSPLLYFVDDTHWTPQGHALVARELAAFLEQ